MKAISRAGFKAGKDVFLALDVAASELYKKGKYHIDGNVWDAGKLVDFYEAIAKKYPIVSIEDGFAQNDWKGWKQFTDRCASTIQIVGDDIFVTNPKIFAEGIWEGASQQHTLSSSIRSARVRKR
jgi:enolase